MKYMFNKKKKENGHMKIVFKSKPINDNEIRKEVVKKFLDTINDFFITNCSELTSVEREMVIDTLARVDCFYDNLRENPRGKLKVDLNEFFRYTKANRENGGKASNVTVTLVNADIERRKQQQSK